MTITRRTAEAVSAPTDGATAFPGRVVEQADANGVLRGCATPDCR